MPASFARRSHVSMLWSPAPPEVTWPFLVARPPNARISARVLDDRRPVRDLADGRLECADHARQEVLRSAEAVVADLVDAAAAEEQEPPHQAAGMVDAAGRRPSIGAAEDRGMAERLAHARKFRGDRVQRLVPGHFVEALGAGALLALAPSLADGRPRDAQRRVHHLRDGLEHVRGRGIARKRLAADHAPVLDQRGEGAPMGQRREARDGHECSGLCDESENGPFAARTQLRACGRTSFAESGARHGRGGIIGAPHSRARATGCESGNRARVTRTRPYCRAYRRSWR